MRMREWSGMAGSVLSGKRPAALVSDPLASLTYLKNRLRVWQVGLIKILPSREQDGRLAPFGSGCWGTGGESGPALVTRVNFCLQEHTREKATDLYTHRAALRSQEFPKKRFRPLGGAWRGSICSRTLQSWGGVALFLSGPKVRAEPRTARHSKGQSGPHLMKNLG